jgi:glycosidase
MVQGVTSGSAEGIDATLREILRTYPAGVTDAPFLTNHDQKRIASQVGGEPGKLQLAAALLLTMPGTPFIYYGEEIGLQNGPEGNDEWKRTPMPWNGGAGGGFTSGDPWYGFAPGQATTHVAAQLNDPASLLSRYRQLIRVRQGSAALRRGALGPLTTGSPAMLAFTRVEGGETVLVVHNLSGSAATSAALQVPGATASKLYDGGGSLTGGSGTWTVTLPARASGIWRLQ